MLQELGRSDVNDKSLLLETDDDIMFNEDFYLNMFFHQNMIAKTVAKKYNKI